MYITKCDICEKQIAQKAIIAGVQFSRSHLYHKCGEPVLTFLKEHKLIDVPEEKKE